MGGKGFFSMVLHAHLPFVRHPEHEFFLEENWLYEALTESYIPLLDSFSRLIDDRVPFRIALSFTPVLLEMLGDELLMSRYVRHLERLTVLAEAEAVRTKKDARLGPVVRWYLGRLRKVRYIFQEVYGCRIVPVLKKLLESGHVEILSSGATHAFLPSLSPNVRAVKAQIAVGALQYALLFQRPVSGIWLPECGYIPGLESMLRQSGFRFFFVETHGLMQTEGPVKEVYAPVRCPSGVFAFGRDTEVSRQVWCSHAGYPGDFFYRDFYRDAGFDVRSPALREFLAPYCTKTFTGLKYYRITGTRGAKKPYERMRALERADVHADHFIVSRERQVEELQRRLGIRPLIVASYDAELFGHWWFEGPDWLEMFFRKLHVKESNFLPVTPTEYLATVKRAEDAEPCFSTWGKNGYGEVWLNAGNDYMQRHQLAAASRMCRLADAYPSATGTARRFLNQAAREVLLAQHSDWAFMISGGHMKEYAQRRFREHIGRFNFLYQTVRNGRFMSAAAGLAEIEHQDNLFNWLEYDVYALQPKVRADPLLRRGVSRRDML